MKGAFILPTSGIKSLIALADNGPFRLSVKQADIIQDL
jgi:hypothetical protein